MLTETPAAPPAATASGPSDAATINARATHGFRLCLARPPRSAELSQLTALYQHELKHYRDHPDAAAELTLGKPAGEKDKSAETADKTNLSEWAAWTVVANVLLNLDSTLTKE
jgi:hypothetical protein